jgi:hypothetical protein
VRGHIRKRGSRYTVVLDAGRDAATGKRKQKWLSGYRTKEEAEDALVELLGKRLRGETIDPDQTPLEGYLSAWIDGRADELAPLTVTQYRSVVRNHVKGTALGGMSRQRDSARRDADREDPPRARPHSRARIARQGAFSVDAQRRAGGRLSVAR